MKKHFYGVRTDNVTRKSRCARQHSLVSRFLITSYGWLNSTGSLTILSHLSDDWQVHKKRPKQVCVSISFSADSHTRPERAQSLHGTQSADYGCDSNYLDAHPTPRRTTPFLQAQFKYD